MECLEFCEKLYFQSYLVKNAQYEICLIAFYSLRILCILYLITAYLLGYCGRVMLLIECLK